MGGPKWVGLIREIKYLWKIIDYYRVDEELRIERISRVKLECTKRFIIQYKDNNLNKFKHDDF